MRKGIVGFAALFGAFLGASQAARAQPLLQTGGQASSWPCLNAFDCESFNCTACTPKCSGFQGVCCDVGHTGTTQIGLTCATDNDCCYGYCDQTSMTCQYPNVLSTNPACLSTTSACGSDSACCSKFCYNGTSGTHDGGICYIADTVQCQTELPTHFGECRTGWCVSYPRSEASTPSNNSYDFNGNCCTSPFPQIPQGPCTCGEDCISGNCNVDGGGNGLCCQVASNGWRMIGDGCNPSNGNSDCCLGWCNPDGGGVCDYYEHTSYSSKIKMEGTGCGTDGTQCTTRTCVGNTCCEAAGAPCRTSKGNLDCCTGLICTANNGALVYSGTCLVPDGGTGCKAQAECVGFDPGFPSPPAIGTPVCEIPVGQSSGTCTLLACSSYKDCARSRSGGYCVNGGCCKGFYDDCTAASECCAGDDLLCAVTDGDGGWCCRDSDHTGHACAFFPECCGWQPGLAQTSYCIPPGAPGQTANTCGHCQSLGTDMTTQVTNYGADAGLLCCSEAINAANNKCCTPIKSLVPTYNASLEERCGQDSDCCQQPNAICINAGCCLKETKGVCAVDADCCDGFCNPATFTCAAVPGTGCNTP
jgi:hypothetical protein